MSHCFNFAPYISHQLLETIIVDNTPRFALVAIKSISCVHIIIHPIENTPNPDDIRSKDEVFIY